MRIKKLIVKNYRALKDVEINFNDHLNIIVGNNECGKSSILEAINLALSGQLNGRNIQNELHPFLFNVSVVDGYIEELRKGERIAPPKIFIELYFSDSNELASLLGTNNTLRENCPGVSFSIEVDEDSFADEFEAYIKSPDDIRTIPVEYYKIVWRSFSGANITSRSIPIIPALIDATSIRSNIGTNRYLIDTVKSNLNRGQRVNLNLSYRKLKDTFLEEGSVRQINDYLLTKKGDISQKVLSLSLDTTSKANWENGIMPHLDEIPMPLIGKGEQQSIKIKLAMDASFDTHLFLIEEPENHLSFTNLNKLITKISERSEGKQLIITTHSSFVLNKLGIENVLLFKGRNNIKLGALSKDTYDYFMKLPGHDTLRLILADKAILVEGPSDELIVQKAFAKRHGRSPLEMGCDVITVNSLAFERFLEIASLLEVPVVVVTDNDGNVQKLEKKYESYKKFHNIKICYDVDEKLKTLEPQLLNANNRNIFNKILGREFLDDESLLNYMRSNKTNCALSIFNSSEEITYPKYIEDAIE